MREITNPYEEIKTGSFLLLKPINTDRFLNWSGEVVAIVESYDNKHSLSALICKTIKIFKISGIVNESSQKRCLAWYKKGFLLLTEPTIEPATWGENIEKEYLKVFLMYKYDIKRLWNIVAKLKIIKGLQDGK